jgi:spore coat protein A, manganese oxidase
MAKSNVASNVQWSNELVDATSGKPYGFPFTSLDGQSVVDTSIYWAFSIPGYEQYTIEQDGVPIVTHIHGGHSKVDVDGNPEHHFTNDYEITGTEFRFKKYNYKNDQPAGTLWYHDHTIGTFKRYSSVLSPFRTPCLTNISMCILFCRKTATGITRLTTYSGLAGFYIVRDKLDNGATVNHPLKLPAGDFEKAYAIQDRMFKDNGELFRPAFKGDPYYEDFITGVGADWDSDIDGPTTMPEFFGDFMLVNGKTTFFRFHKLPYQES